MIEPKEILKVPFGPDSIWIAIEGSRPYVALQPLCKALGISYSSQWARVELRRYLLRATEINALLDGEHIQLRSIPLENLAWFLLTLRPRSRQIRERVDQYKRDLTYHLFYFWFRFTKEGYVSTKEYAAHLRTLRLNSAPPRRPPTVRHHLTKKDVEQMKLLRDEGRSLRQIGDTIGFSPSVVSQCLRGIYPVKLK